MFNLPKFALYFYFIYSMDDQPLEAIGPFNGPACRQYEAMFFRGTPSRDYLGRCATINQLAELKVARFSFPGT